MIATATGWSQIGFARVAELLGSRAGLSFSPARIPSAEQAMRRAMEASRETNPTRYAARLQDDPRAFDALLAEVTIGETYFFREPAQLEYIRRSVLPALRNRPDGRPMRVWSAGCASGEEPYTLAIILSEDSPGERARILGTEVSRPRLDAARRARYGRWSLRSLADPVIRRYFTQRGAHYFLRPDIRAMVDFGYLNLADGDYPGSAFDIRDMDLVLCRNVLIYLDRATVAEVAKRMLASLSEDGWLFLGASDPPLVDLVPCEVVVTGAGLAYRRPRVDSAPGRRRPPLDEPVSALATVVAQGLYTTIREGAAADSGPAPDAAQESHAPGLGLPHDPPAIPGGAVAAPHPPVPDAAVRTEPAESAAGAVSPDSPASRARTAYQARDYPAAAREAAAAIDAGAADAELRVLHVRALANAGSLTEAGRACASALEVHPTHAELAYLHALLLAESGRLEESISAVRGAIFLDRRLIVAHMLLGGLQARMNQGKDARRAFENAEHLLEALSPDAIVPASDGEPVRRVREAARVQRDLMTATTS